MVKFQKRCLAKEIIEKNGKTITLDAKHLKCYDISSWTDKFHRDLQKIVVKKLFSARFAEAWAQLVVHCDWYYPKLDCTVKYGQGQGMGTNGSFDIATLTDHLYINFIIDRKTTFKGVFPSNECYGKVGDDLWIYDPEDQIPVFYEKISLPINTSKSKFFCGNSSYMEFCSRTFFDAEDVSRISPNIINKSKDYRYIPMLLGLCSSRGIQLDASLFETLNNNVKNSELTYLHKLQDWIVGMLLIGQYEQSSYWKSLTYDYLVAGNWVIGDLVKDLYQDPKLLTRLMVAHSIVTITENLEAVQNKIFEILDASEIYSDR
uniref:RdRp n=1 Tax=viral metagenome TaxID=1070528 RepID=A0A2V0RB88_9ZZZZ